MPRVDEPRALRAEVTRLANARHEDIKAILDVLDGDQRTRVEQLLDEYRAADPRALPLQPPGRADEHVDMAGLSPWLVERLSVDPRSTERLTPRAAEALREAALSALPSGAPVAPAPGSLLSRLYERIIGRGNET